MTDVLSPEALTALLQVIMIDLVLAGDNAIVIGLAAAGLPPEQRSKAILIGIGAATGLRIVFALTTTQLLLLGPGLLVGGGLLLLWVCWKMWRELRVSHSEAHAANEALAGQHLGTGGTVAEGGRTKTFAQAAWQIVIADVSMSLDNVLAVAGAALEHPYVLIFGLVLSIALMGVAATFIARLLQRHRWIAYIGLLIILYVALSMIWDGAHDYFGAPEAADLALRFFLPGWLSNFGSVDLLAELCAAEAGAAEEIVELRIVPRRSLSSLAG